MMAKTMAKKPANGATDKPNQKTPPEPLPNTLTRTLPASLSIMQHVSAIQNLLPELRDQMAEAKKGGAVPVARAFTVLHRLAATIEDRIKPLYALFELYKIVEVPAAFEHEGVPSIPLAEGYRVGVSVTTRASIRAEVKQDAFNYLKKTYPDVISETVNASTLSALARALLEDENKELPDKLFNVARVPNTSVTKT